MSNELMNQKLSCEKSNPISSAILDVLSSKYKPTLKNSTHNMDRIGARSPFGELYEKSPSCQSPPLTKNNQMGDHDWKIAPSQESPTPESDMAKYESILALPSKHQPISMVKLDESRSVLSSELTQATCNPKIMTSKGMGELFREMIDAVAELLKSLLTLNVNSTLKEVTDVLFCGNRFLYLVLLVVMIMFLRRLLVALFLL